MAPQILAKKDRGKPTEASKQVVLAEYGSLQSKSFLPGAEILPVDKGLCFKISYLSKFYFLAKLVNKRFIKGFVLSANFRDD